MLKECAAIAAVLQNPAFCRYLRRFWIRPLFWISRFVVVTPGFGDVRLNRFWKRVLLDEVKRQATDPGAPPVTPPPISTCLDLVNTPEGQARLRAYLDALPFPHFEAVPDRPDLLVKIEKNGGRMIGRLEGRTFTPVAHRAFNPAARLGAMPDDRTAILQRLGGPELLALLEETLTPRGAVQWCSAANRLLQGQRPIDCLRAGQHEAVLQAARAYVEGNYV
jgi:hypothetical protein